MVFNIVSCAYFPSNTFFGKMFIQIIRHFLVGYLLLLLSLRVLYESLTPVLSQVHFLQVFLLSWLFNIFLMISDNNQTFYISVKSFFFSFMVISFHDTNIFCLTLNQKRSFHVFFPKFLALAGDFPGASDNKESACIAGDPSLSLRSGRSPGEGNDNSLQHSCLDRGAWWAAVYGVTKSQTWLSD